MAKDIQPINKGIVQDSNEEFQPEGTYRFMLNGMFESLEGERGGVVNEQGNEIILPMPPGVTDPHLNGTCLLPNQDVVLFITGWDGWQDIQIIALHKNNDTYLELIRTNCLEYTRCMQIDCKFKVHNGCDIILYFTDHETKYKSINITAIENNTIRYKIDSYQNWTFPDPVTGTDPNIPDVDPDPMTGGIGNYGWLCDGFYLTPVSEHPNIFLHDVTENGNLRVGTYTFFIRLLDSDLNPTDWLTWSNPITVKQGVFNATHPASNTDGFYIDPNISNFTSKSIMLIIDNLDPAFQYYEVGIMERSLNTDTVSFAYRTNQKLIPTTGTDIFIFSNVNDIRFTNIDPSVLLTKNRKVDIVQAHTQIQNRLILGNIKGITRDWHRFQQQANLIKTEYFTYSKVDIADTGCSAKKHHVVSGSKALDPLYEAVNYSSPEFLSYGMSLMRDEIYALGIIYVFKDGSESPVFHIPGRPKFGTGEETSYIVDGFDYAFYARECIHTQSETTRDGLGQLGVGPPAAFTTGNLLLFDNQPLTVEQHSNVKGSWQSTRLGNLPQRNTDILDLGADDYKYLYGWQDIVTCCYNVPFTNASCSDGMERWTYYNTAIRRKVDYDVNNFGEVFESVLNIIVQPDNGLGPPAPPDTSYIVDYTIDGVPFQYIANPAVVTGVGGIDIVTTTGVLVYVGITITADNATARPGIPTVTTTYVSGFPTLAETIWNSLDATSNIASAALGNPYYTFSEGFRGIPGYYDTGINYPDVLDCDGNRIYPEGPVRHHRMPDHRIEQLFDMVGDLGLNQVTDGGGTTSESGWLGFSNIVTAVVTANFTGPSDIDGIDPRPWKFNDSESTFQLYPLGLNFHNVNVPEEFRDEVVGYYIVRSDRANNKTVIDKGFMNVCDTSITTKDWDPLFANHYELIDEFSNLVTPTEDNNIMYPNELFLTPATKSGKGNTGVNGWYNQPTTSFYNVKQATWGWWNIMELHTPKSSYNDPVLLGGDYLKLEATVFGDMFFDSNISEYQGPGVAIGSGDYFIRHPTGGPMAPSTGWNTAASVVLNRHKYPRVQSPVWALDDPTTELSNGYVLNSNRWAFVYNIPISGMSYVGYDDVITNSALGGSTTSIFNELFQQKTLLAKHTQSCISADPLSPFIVLNACTDITPTSNIDAFRSACDVSFPFHYTMLKKDILHNGIDTLYILPTGTPGNWRIDDVILESSLGSAYASYTNWSDSYDVTGTNKWSVPHSPYMYYFALKSSINPYEDFDGIRYIKMHSYMFPSDPAALAADQSFAVTGGDTFISRFQFEKGRWSVGSSYGVDNAQIGVPPTNQNTRFLATLTVGYVESEINAGFTHLKDGDLFRTYPYNGRHEYWGFLGLANTIVTGTSDSERETNMDEFMAKQEIFYRYKLDYSSYNSEVVSFQLPSTWDYCSNCQESFPNTLIYSEVSLDSQVQDYYKIFLTNSEKDIPSYTGSIQNLFVKNSDLYIHTEHNLWKISVAPQTMQTNSDTVEVGQGAFLDREAIRIFNNQDAFSRGGCIDKFTSVYGGGDYVWLDRNSGSVLSLSEGMGSLSDIGLSRWFRNNTELNLNTQFMALTGLEYPFKGTSCNLNVGYIATLDPQHNRYILTKKDYKLTEEVLTGLAELTYGLDESNNIIFDPEITAGNYYYDDDGFYIGIGTGSVVADRDTLLEYIDLTDPIIAENKSWTISYSFKDKLWSSWHSYLPNWLYNDSYTFYSFITHPLTTSNESIWRHGFGEFQTYYGTKYDFIIDYIYKKDMYSDATYDTLEYTSNSWVKSVINDTWVEVPFITFDRFYVYNNTQLSNLKDILVSNQTAYRQIDYNVAEATAHNWRNIWRIARLRDMSVDRLAMTEPKFTTNWLEPTYQAEFTNGGYIDKVINPAMLDILKPVYKIERLTDKYLGIRLFYNPEEDYKITFNIYSGLKRNKI